MLADWFFSNKLYSSNVYVFLWKKTCRAIVKYFLENNVSSLFSLFPFIASANWNCVILSIGILKASEGENYQSQLVSLTLLVAIILFISFCSLGTLGPTLLQGIAFHVPVWKAAHALSQLIVFNLLKLKKKTNCQESNINLFYVAKIPIYFSMVEMKANFINANLNHRFCIRPVCFTFHSIAILCSVVWFFVGRSHV